MGGLAPTASAAAAAKQDWVSHRSAAAEFTLEISRGTERLLWENRLFKFILCSYRFVHGPRRQRFVATWPLLRLPRA